MSWFKRPKIGINSDPDLASSILYDEHTFYNRFNQDLLEAKEEVIIESPFITIPRLATLKSIFEELIQHGVEVFIITRYPEEHG